MRDRAPRRYRRRVAQGDEGTDAGERRESVASDAVEIVREALRRWAGDEPFDDLLAPGYAVTGSPTPFQTTVGADAEERRAQMKQHAQFRFHDVVAGTTGRVLFTGQWIHRSQDGAGSSGLYWGVFTVRDGRLGSLLLLHDRLAARRAAGLD